MPRPAVSFPHPCVVAGSGTQANASSNWQLLVGHYIKAKMTPVIIHPRPDSETTASERHRLAPSGIPWRIPVLVKGGAWPFEVTLSVAPTGMVVGSIYGSTDYGILTWDNPVVGTHSVTVRVRTQDYSRTSGSADATGEVTVSFTLVVVDHTDITKFVYLDGVNGNDSNDGSYASPWKTLTSFNAASTANKQVFFKTGTYSTQVLAANLALTAGSKAAVLVGMPGETANISIDGSLIRYLSLTGPGAFVGNLTTSGGTTTAGDVYHWRSSGDRMTMFESISQGLYDVAGSGSFTNHSGWSMFADSALHQYVGIKNCIFKDYTNITNGGGSIWYSVTDSVYEGNSVTGMNTGGSTEGFRTKGRCDNITMRNNRAPTLQSLGQSVFSHYQGGDGGQGNLANNNEMCWNYAVGPNNRDTGAAAYGRNTQASWNGWMYRNTFKGAVVIGSNGFTCGLISENNVLCDFSSTANDMYSQNIVGLTVTGSNNSLTSFGNAANVIDSNGLLLAAYLTANGLVRGQRGHEVA